MKKSALHLNGSFLYGLVFLFALGLVGTFLAGDAAAQIRPAYTKNVDEPGRVPWETRSQFLPNAGGCWVPQDCYNYEDGSGYATFDLRPVPAGKRWIVQMATGGLVNGQGRITNIELRNTRGFLVFDGVKWTFGGPFSQGTSFDSVIFNAPLWAEFGPGETPTVRVTGDPSLSGYSVIVFTGYLIDAN